MIALIAFCAGMLVVIAVVIGILDAVQAAAWRAIAAQRRELWEAHQAAAHRTGPSSVDNWYHG